MRTAEGASLERGRGAAWDLRLAAKQPAGSAARRTARVDVEKKASGRGAGGETAGKAEQQRSHRGSWFAASVDCWTSARYCRPRPRSCCIMLAVAFGGLADGSRCA